MWMDRNLAQLIWGRIMLIVNISGRQHWVGVAANNLWAPRTCFYVFLQCF